MEIALELPKDIQQLEVRRSELVRSRSETHFLGRIKTRKLIGKFVRNSSLQMFFNDISKKEYANLGAGGNILKGYINIDYSWSPGLDLCWDITKPLPLKSNSLKGVFTEHTLEHLVWTDALKTMLPEAFRILSPGGTIRVSVPDAEIAVLDYCRAVSQGETCTPWREPYDWGDRIPMTPMMETNNVYRRIYEPLYMGHKFAYDFQTLEYFLHLVGFVDIKKESYMRGRDTAILVDYKKRAAESLYVEATKPIS